MLRPTDLLDRTVSKTERLDDRVLRWMAETDHGPLRPVLRVTARFADALLPQVTASLWSAIEGSSAEKEAIIRAWVAMGLAAAIQDVIKPVIGRGRPDPQRLPPEQRRQRSVSTSAFPSGHVAVSSAFSVATGRGAPRLRSWMALGTAVIAYARAYTGRHYLSDTLVGTAIGAGAGLLSYRLPLGPLIDRIHERPSPGQQAGASG